MNSTAKPWKRIHHLLGMPVITVQEGIRLGAVKGVELDATARQIAYLHFDGADTRADGVVPWERVRAVGADAITIPSLADVLEAIPAAERDRVTPDVGDRPVMTESGTRLGRVTSYDWVACAATMGRRNSPAASLTCW